MKPIAQIIFNLLIALVEDKTFRHLVAGGLEHIMTKTENKIDDAILTPVINALRAE